MGSPGAVSIIFVIPGSQEPDIWDLLDMVSYIKGLRGNNNNLQ